MGSRQAGSDGKRPECSLDQSLTGESRNSAQPSTAVPPTPEAAQEAREEERKIRRLQMMMNMVMSVIGQDETLTIEEAAELVADSKNAALAMFPDKELAYNLIYKPRLQRLMRERFRIQ